MRRMFLVLAVTIGLLATSSAIAQTTSSGGPSALKRSTASGLEVSILEVSKVERLNRLGQPVVKFGSCPPGAVPEGMKDLDLIVPGQAVIVHFTIRVLPAYKSRELAGPPKVIDAEGAKHEPHGLYFLPAVDLLMKHKQSGELLHCEFPYATAAEAVRKIEFEGQSFPRP